MKKSVKQLTRHTRNSEIRESPEFNLKLNNVLMGLQVCWWLWFSSTSWPGSPSYGEPSSSGMRIAHPCTSRDNLFPCLADPHVQEFKFFLACNWNKKLKFINEAFCFDPFLVILSYWSLDFSFLGFLIFFWGSVCL